ncbi:hypothetical protein DWB61_06975 [Ancylomarina euxinus]|uniref:Uncharacterized protein n=1 Tax=Ancylomarina euxinus TaxID=2283627 RepID=A0A425Y2Y2_9BACT|nr:hypothetical protein [Ancylomarina euxinus]MCZ4693187.1 hypothetical protein [Ancylomarina euxinus]MUP15324.1 hypothetical protein [Ancylomarina euxinus]RRG22548.1 hypothetical protein DWB61_06975 [Ancylomarina euxinus]
MRIILSLAFIVIVNLSVIAQDKLIVLHSVVGDTIDKREQQEFLLFSDILDQNFTSATIHFENGKYVMYITSASDLKIVDIKEEDVEENSKHVDKLVRYFKSLIEKKDSLDIDLDTASGWPEFQPELLNNAQKRKIAKEARRYFNLNQDAVQLGLSGIDKENYIKVNSKSWLVESLFDILQ